MKPVRHPLARYLAKSKLGAEQFAEVAGISRPSVYRILAGEEVRLSIANKAAKATRGKVKLQELADNVR
jgi:predicted transcriptional regulator